MQPVLSSVLLRGLGALAGDPEIASVVTDSREAGPGSLFVCIRGERVDGHDYALRALEAGAAGVVVQRPVPGVPPEKCVQAPDALDAMIRLGANYRALYSPLLAGVTGSVGKTTTKEFCYAVFSAFGKTLRTEGNQNNEIGMPNTLFRLDKSVEYAVVEMGMQGLGEIRKLTLAAKPAGAVITCIGRSHLEQLGTRENILRAKLEICEGLPQGAPLVVNGDDDYLPGAAVRPDLEKVLFAVENPDADVRALDIVSGAEGTRFTIADKAHGSLPAYIPAMGLHNVRNALSAYALATRLGLAPAAAAAALANYQTTGHRQHVVEYGGVTVIDDCYNANPDSMRAALLTAQKMADSMVAEAEEKKKSLLENAESEANRKIGALRDEVAQEERRLTAAKAETADFLARVRELYEREMKLLEELPEADLAPAAPLELAKPAADVSEIEKSIMDSFKLPDLTKAAEGEPEAEEAPEEPEESPEEGNPFLDSATRAIKLSDLKFGRNYHGEE